MLLKGKCVTCCALTFTDHFSYTAIYLPCNKRASVNKIEKPLNLFKKIDFDANMRIRTCWNCRRIYGSQETHASHWEGINWVNNYDFTAVCIKTILKDGWMFSNEPFQSSFLLVGSLARTIEYSFRQVTRVPVGSHQFTSFREVQIHWRVLWVNGKTYFYFSQIRGSRDLLQTGAVEHEYLCCLLNKKLRKPIIPNNNRNLSF